MKKSANENTLFEALKALEKEIQLSVDNNIPMTNYNFKEFILKLNKYLYSAKLIIITLFLLFCISSAAFLYMVYLNDQREDFDETIMDIMDIELDKNGNKVYKYRESFGKPLKYSEILSDYDSLELEYKNYISKKDSTFQEYILLYQKYSKLQEDYSFSELKLNTIYENYPIKIKEFKNQSYKSIELVAPKIDSGLVLLEVYRDKLKYDPKTKTWTVN